MDEKFKPDLANYEIFSRENRELFDPLMESQRQAVLEYGMLLIKNIILLNGGALVALPPLLTFLNKVALGDVLFSAKCFVVGLVLAIATGYVSHLNWLFIYTATEKNKRIRENQGILWHLGDHYVEKELVEAQSKQKSPMRKSILGSFWTAHLLGVFSLVAFATGCLSLLS